jgi:serine/threonine protein kinase
VVDRLNDRDPSSATALGSTVSHYRIVEELGAGGMGVVYRAEDLNHPRQVALKRPRPELSDDPLVRRRFQREARAASAILHPNVVTVFEVFEAQGGDWIAMELVEGETLKDLLRRNGPLPVEEILRYAEGLADALRAGHAKGILHRDVNPKNVLVDADGKARLADFGLAKRIPVGGEGVPDQTTTPSLTDTGQIIGTTVYMSPEQALGRPTDARSDLYSLGAVIYEMCTGEPVFPPGPAGDLLDAILQREPNPISRAYYAIPGELERIVRKCLAKRPDERYQDARDLLVDLRALMRVSAVGAYADDKPAKRARSIAVSTLAVFAVAAVSATVWYPRDPTRRSPQPLSRQVTAAPDGSPIRRFLPTGA